MHARRPSLGSTVFGVVFASVLAMPSSARAEETVRVHITSSVPVTLERHAAENGTWQLACSAPCDEELALAAEYRLIDPKRRVAGDPIRLRGAPGGEVTLTYKQTSTAAKVGGGVLVGAGSLLAAAGTLSLVEGVVLLAAAGGCGEGSGDWCGLGQAIGAFLTVVGGLGMIGGGGMILGGVTLLTGSDPSMTQRSTEKSSFVREPTWTAPRAASTPGPAMFVPLSVSF